MRKLILLLAALTVPLAAMVMVAPSAGATGAGYFTYCTGVAPNGNGWKSANPLVADGVTARMAPRPPMNLGWPYGYCQGDSGATNWTIQTLLYGGASSTGHYAWAQVQVLNAIDKGGTALISYQWTADWYPGCVIGTSCQVYGGEYPTVHPDNGVYWWYTIQKEASGLLGIHVVANNGGTLDIGTYLPASGVINPRPEIKGETGHLETGFLGGHGGALASFDTWKYHTPAFGGAWTPVTDDPNNPSKTAYILPPAGTHDGYVHGDSDSFQCASSPNQCEFHFGEG